MEYNIGQRVKVKPYGELPESMKRRGGLPKVCGLQGEIVDKVHSEAKACTIYKIIFDGAGVVSSAEFIDGSFDAIKDNPAPVTYLHEFDYLENLVVVRFYEVYEDGTRVEIAKGHGHIFHDGALGIAQAASYALKKLYQKLEEDNN